MWQGQHAELAECLRWKTYFAQLLPGGLFLVPGHFSRFCPVISRGGLVLLPGHFCPVGGQSFALFLPGGWVVLPGHFCMILPGLCAFASVQRTESKVALLLSAYRWHHRAQHFFVLPREVWRTQQVFLGKRKLCLANRPCLSFLRESASLSEGAAIADNAQRTVPPQTSRKTLFSTWLALLYTSLCWSHNLHILTMTWLLLLTASSVYDYKHARTKLRCWLITVFTGASQQLSTHSPGQARPNKHIS